MNNDEIIIERETPPGVEKQVDEIIIERGAGQGLPGIDGTFPALNDLDLKPVVVGADLALVGDSADSFSNKKTTWNGVYAWFRSLFSSIDYRNPITLTGTVTPTNGQFFTTDSKLLTLTGSGGEKFWPNGGATSRIIWGSGSGAELPVVIDPVNLGIGGVLEIAIGDGESRKIRYDGTDFVKIGGVVIKLSCYMNKVIEGSPLTVADLVATKTDLDFTTSDNSGQMADPITNKRIDIIRPGNYSLSGSVVWGDGLAGQTVDHETQVRFHANGSQIDNIKGYIHNGQAFGFGTISEQKNGVILAAGDYLELYGRHNGVGFSEPLNQFRGATISNYLVVTEEDPW